MSDSAWDGFDADQKRKITSFNTGTGADPDVSCQSGAHESSPNLEIGRWWGEVYNTRSADTLEIEQRINLDFTVTRDHKYLVGEDDFRANHADTGNDKIYNADAVAANHVIGNPVFDADPSYTMSSIISYGSTGTFDPDTVNLKQNAPYTRALTADPDEAQIPAATDFFSDLDGPHITITVPKKVRIRSETADVTPETRTVCE